MASDVYREVTVMRRDIDKAFKDGRSARRQGHLDEAIRYYEHGAALARSTNDEQSLAHALRHISDIARELGDAERALEAGVEAVALYRAKGGPVLDLANALRVNALALQATGKLAAARLLWVEARRLYADLGVRAGVEECDHHLSA